MGSASTRVAALCALGLLVGAWAAETVERIPCAFGGQLIELTLTGGAAAAATADGTAPAALAATVGGQPVQLTGAIAIGLAPGADAAALAARLGLVVQRVAGRTAFLAPPAGADPRAALRALPRLAAVDAAGTRWSEPVVASARHARADPGDPRFAEQWYLRNTGQVTGAVAGNDLHVLPAWDTATGGGVRVAIVDTGVDASHPDLLANIAAGEGRDFIDADDDPSPDDAHGTMVGGLVAARRNAIGVVGVAYDALLVPLRLIGGTTTTADAADAFRWHHDTPEEVLVSNNSWGPDDDGHDDGAVIEQPSAVELQALADGFNLGRGGLGTTYVWACGNGAGSQDTCDRDGYANSRYVIAVGATRANGTRASYSEMGACLFVNAPVGDTSAQGALSTVPGSAYASGLGTSFSSPMVAGVVALMLEANPALGTRDVRDILARTATRNDPFDANWLTNGAGLRWNLQYGFGRVDAAAAVAAAVDPTWTPLPAEAAPLTVGATMTLAIPDGSEAFTGSAAAVALPLSGDPRFRAETVELTIAASHPRQGDLAFTLTSPRGAAVTFLARSNDTAPARTWTMSSVATWGEDPRGSWTVVAHDVRAGVSGTLTGLTLTVHGHLAASAAAPGTATASGGSRIVGAGGQFLVPPPVEPASDDDDDDHCGLGGLAVLLVALRLLLAPVRLRRAASASVPSESPR